MGTPLLICYHSVPPSKPWHCGRASNGQRLHQHDRRNTQARRRGAGPSCVIWQRKVPSWLCRDASTGECLQQHDQLNLPVPLRHRPVALSSSRQTKSFWKGYQLT